ncbi:hypothetical protein KQX54_000087, partial [Cotesia glomerata]
RGLCQASIPRLNKQMYILSFSEGPQYLHIAIVRSSHPWQRNGTSGSLFITATPTPQQNPVDFETPKNNLSNKRKPGRPTNRDSLVLHRSSSTCSIKELFSKRKKGLEESFEKSFLDETAFCIGSAKKKINKEDSDLLDNFDQDDLLATSSPTDMATERILSEIKKIRVDATEKFESLSLLITEKVDQVKEEQKKEVAALREEIKALDSKWELEHAKLSQEVETLKHKPGAGLSGHNANIPIPAEQNKSATLIKKFA